MMRTFRVLPRWYLLLSVLPCALLSLLIGEVGADDGSLSGHVERRAERTAEERQRWVEELRRLYERDPAEWPAPHVDPVVEWVEIGHLPPVVHPEKNPDSKAKRLLGETLFFDPRLSGSEQVACASCHDPDLAWADGRSTGFGHARTRLTRNTPSIRNSGYHKALFWDGRAASLEEQASAVLNNPDEMRSSASLIGDRLRRSEGYRRMMAESFPAEQGYPPVSEWTDEEWLARVSDALACFQRGVVGGRSRFDSFVRGRYRALEDDELIGLDLFRREGRCLNCHHGPAFSDGKFHDLGLSNLGRRFEDLGRWEITGDPADAGGFRTPSLRDVARTAPYMHSGLFDLEALLNLYNRGMFNLTRRAIANAEGPIPQKSPLLRPLGLNRTDLADLKAFLETLSEPWQRTEVPELPEIGAIDETAPVATAVEVVAPAEAP